MAVDKVWVYAETDAEKVTTATLEMLTKAREIGEHGRGDLRRQEPDRRGRRVGRRVRRDEAVRGRPR